MIESTEMSGVFVDAIVKLFVCYADRYVTTNPSSVMRSSDTETISEAHVCFSLPHDTQRGISICVVMYAVWLKYSVLCTLGSDKSVWTYLQNE